MNSNYNTILIPNSIKKVLEDITRLERIGKISTIEIELDFSTEVLSDMIDICSTSSGVFFIQQGIFINYPELEISGLKFLLSQIYQMYGEDVLESLLVYMEIPAFGKKITAALEISTDTDLPQMISISEQDRFFEFLNGFHVAWYGVAFQNN